MRTLLFPFPRIVRLAATRPCRPPREVVATRRPLAAFAAIVGVVGAAAVFAVPHAARGERPAVWPTWTWTGPAPGDPAAIVPRVEVQSPTGVRCVFASLPGRRTSALACVDTHSRPMWAVPDASAGSFAAAALLFEGPTLYVVRYNHFATGAGVTAYDVSTGAVRWTTRLRGLGPIGHSEYYNEVRVAWLRGVLGVRGWETGGRYIETLDPATGRTIDVRRLPPQR